MTYATAYAGLVRYGGLRAGERVLIQAAAGGVGIAATQIAKLRRRRGLRHRVARRSTTRSAASASTTRSTTARTTWSTRCAASAASSSRSTWSSTRSAAAASARASPCCGPGGRLVCFGASEVQAGERRSPLRALRVLAQMPRFNPLKLMSESKSVIGLNMLTLWDEQSSLDEFVEPLRRGSTRRQPSARW